METRLPVPDLPDPTAAAHDLAACRALLADGSRTFLAASWLLPRAVREPACALYAYCRQADDEVDGVADPAAAVAGLRQRLAALYAGRAGDRLADRALAVVAARHAIPPALPEALIEGFAWDAEGRRYETLHELQAYAARVAGTVGAMMALLMGVRDPAALARACELGIAMQLSNIARDVGEDAAMGRLYLPRAWLREAGIDPEAWLARPVHSAALAGVVQRLLHAADDLYARVGAGVAELPLACRPGINAARYLYAEIGHEVRRRGLDPLAGRAVVSRRRKLLGLLRAVLALRPPRGAQAAAPLPASAFLVAAVQAWPAPVLPLPWWSLKARAVRTIELFAALEQRDRQPAPGWPR
jgi:phytoene synthase